MHSIAQCRTKKKPDMHKHCWIVSLIAFKRISFFFFFQTALWTNAVSTSTMGEKFFWHKKKEVSSKVP